MSKATYVAHKTPLSRQAETSALRRRGWLQRKRSGLAVGRPDDRHEREAERVADMVMHGVAPRTFSLTTLPIVRREDAPKPKTDDEKYQDAAKKLGEAFLATPIGKELTDKVKQDPLVKGATKLGESFVSTLPGKIITGAVAVGAVGALAATHQPLPAQLPDIPLDVLTPGLKVNISYEGPVDKPTKAMITFSFSEGAGVAKKPALSESDRIKADTERLRAEDARFRAGTRYSPGSPEDLQQKAEREAIERFVAGQRFPHGDTTIKQYPFLQQPAQPRLQLQTPQPSFGYRPPDLFGDMFKLKTPELRLSGETEKKKEDQLMRKSAGDAAVDTAPPVVHETLESAGQPLDTTTRAFMERRFGLDFSQVRIHTDARAAESARAVNALAYTVGRDVVFDTSQYAPGTDAGKRLLAHELAHVAQQEPGRLSRMSDDSLHGIGQGGGHAAPQGLTGVTFSTGNLEVHVPLCGITQVVAGTAPANVAVTWSLAAGTAQIAAGTQINARGEITFGQAQTGGTLDVTATETGAAGRFFTRPLQLSSHPASINSTSVISPPATNAASLYGAVFDHDFASADGTTSSLENVPAGERFAALPNPTGTSHTFPTPFGSFTLQTAALPATPANGQNWFIRNGSLGGDHDTVTIGRAGINVGDFVASASKPNPTNTLPVSFTIVQGLHWFCRQSSQWTKFVDVDHVRTLRNTSGAIEFVVSVNRQDNVDSYTGHPGIVNAHATPATIPPTASAASPSQTTVSADTLPSALPAGHALRFSIRAPALGCSINATTGVLTAGGQTGAITVRVRDSAAANPNFDETVVRIAAPAPTPTPTPGPGAGGATQAAPTAQSSDESPVEP
jgi:hypothetical protein